MNRYQVYLQPHSVSILDEAGEVSGLSRSRLIQEAVDAASNRLGNLLAGLMPTTKKKPDYSWLDDLVGVVKVSGKKMVNLSENIDEIYYQ